MSFTPRDKEEKIALDRAVELRLEFFNKTGKSMSNTKLRVAMKSEGFSTHHRELASCLTGKDGY